MTHGWVGATPYMYQRIDETATVIEILDEAGAVLVAERLSHGPVRSRRRIPANESTPGPAQEETPAVMTDLDVLVSPSFEGGTLGITNLTGHPYVCIPDALRPVEEGTEAKWPLGRISIVGPLYRDAATLTLAHAIQEETDVHTRRSPLR